MTYNRDTSIECRCFTCGFNMDRGTRCILVEREGEIYELKMTPNVMKMKLIDFIKNIQHEVFNNGKIEKRQD